MFHLNLPSLSPNKEKLVAALSLLHFQFDMIALSETKINDINHSFDTFDQKINEVLDKHVRLKKHSKKELCLQAKPWITTGILKYIKQRDILFKKIY